MVRAFLAFLFMAFATPALAQTVERGDLKLELAFEERSGPLYTGEMVLLKVRGFYKIRIAREKLIQADLDGFDWMQLGEDTWSKDLSQGGEILQFERVIALFPNRAGTLEIKPFTHQLELWTRTGERYDHILDSGPISIDVTERPASEDWWLPARRLTVEDRWSNAPDRLGTGEGALRIVTVTVEGVRPEQVPPMPELKSAGAFVFPHPEKRITRLYKRGPVTRTFWRWTVRPENPPSAYLEPIRLPYFDTKAREHREIVLAAQRIAMTEEAVAAYLAEADAESVAVMKNESKRRAEAVDTFHLAGFAAPVGLLSGLIVGFSFLTSGLGGRRRRATGGIGQMWTRLRPDPDIGALHRAAALEDGSAARAAAMRLIARGRGDTDKMKSAVRDFDRSIFGRSRKSPDLKQFASSVSGAAKSSGS